MNFKKIGLGLAVTAAITTGIALTEKPAEAISLFSDNFDTENGGSGALNFNGFSKWDVTDGTVDLIPAGGQFDFYPGNGLYIDLDGSTGNAGILTTKTTFAAGTYNLSFKLGGNARGSAADAVTVNLGLGNFSEVFTLNSGDPLTTFVRTITLTSAGKLSFSNAGGDNIGAILDDVNLTTIPTPALLPGLIGMGLAAMRKRRNEQVEHSETVKA